MPYAAFLVLDVICVLIGFFAAQPSGEINGLCEYSVNVSFLQRKGLCGDISLPDIYLIPESLLQKWNTNPGVSQIDAFTLSDVNPRSSISSQTSQHTLGHVNCRACEAERAAIVSGLGELSFREASGIWLEQHALYIQARTLHDYKQYLKPLNEFLGDAKLSDIHIGTVRSYQQGRRQQASHHKVNSEIRSVLKPVMREAGLWEGIAALYRALPVDRSGAGKSYSQEQEQAFLEQAFSRKRWMLCGHAFNVAINTGMGFGELRHLRASEFIDDHSPRILISEGAKNEARHRIIPLNRQALESMRWIRERWKRLGGTAPDQYLLPARAKGKNAPTRFYEPMSSVKTAFYQIRKAASLPSEPWKGMRFYDCRPTAITRTLSSGNVSLHTAQKLYGHVSEEMQKRYYKPQLELLREAVTKLEKKPPTKQRSQPVQISWTSSTSF